MSIYSDEGDLCQGEIEDSENWYNEYVKRTAIAIKEARAYLEVLDQDQQLIQANTDASIKLKRLEIPKFKSEPTKFYKWKRMFERFTQRCDDALKYDYLLCCTDGEARRYVENRNDYAVAMEKLEEKYGNKHMIISLLIDEIKVLSIVKRGDFKSFENLFIKVNDFHEKLTLMNNSKDAENSYILKEIESKLNADDLQKWLESRGDDVDIRTVGDLVTWLDKQTHIRWSIFTSKLERHVSNSSYGRPPLNSTNVTINSKCGVCGSEHQLNECAEFVKLSLAERWDQVKKRKACFICLRDNHRRAECTETSCDACTAGHNKLLHNFMYSRDGGLPRINSTPSNTLVNDGGRLRRCFLPAAVVKLCGKGKEILSMAVLDSLSEVNIITARCCEQLKLKGTTVVLDIIGAGGTKTNFRTKVVEVSVIDKRNQETVLECIVLNQACGRMLPVDTNIFDDAEKRLLTEKEVFVGGGDVDILIGMTRPHLHKQLSFTGIRNGLALIETQLGNCLVGTPETNSSGNHEAGTYDIDSISIARELDSESGLLEHLQSELAGINGVDNGERNEEEV